MKLILPILKDLQDSGQDATIIGHFSIQTGSFQKVTNIDNVNNRPKIRLSGVEGHQSLNRYITEQEQNTDRIPLEPSMTTYSGELPPDLVRVITIWSDLPESVKAGIIAMSEAVASNI